jgi:hypothetical protein
MVPPEGTGGERSEPTGPAGGTIGAARPEPEVLEKATRRTFTADYKRYVLRQADACKGSGEVGAFLRREGLYSSHLTSWRRQRERGEIEGLAPKKRGHKRHREMVPVQEVERLQRENQKLRWRVEQAELIIDIQKKASEMLGIPLRSLPSDDND